MYLLGLPRPYSEFYTSVPRLLHVFFLHVAKEPKLFLVPVVSDSGNIIAEITPVDLCMLTQLKLKGGI